MKITAYFKNDNNKAEIISKNLIRRGKIKFLLLLYALLAWCLLFNGCDKDTNNNDKGDWVLINGIKWATRNLDTHGHFVAKPEDFGGLFQWGRKGDGHERRTSPSYPTNNSSPEEGVVSVPYLDANGQVVNTHAAYGKFIKNDYSTSSHDWRSPQNNALWNTGSEVSPVKALTIHVHPVGAYQPRQNLRNLSIRAVYGHPRMAFTVADLVVTAIQFFCLLPVCVVWTESLAL